jgi:ribosome-binding protein aMBF1 (putative translation factor)
MSRQKKQRRNKQTSRAYAQNFKALHPDMADAYEAFLVVVKLARLGAGYSHKRLAELIGTTEKNIRDFENGEDEISGAVYQELKKVLKIQIHCDPTPEDFAKMEGGGVMIDMRHRKHLLN